MKKTWPVFVAGVLMAVMVLCVGCHDANVIYQSDNVTVTELNDPQRQDVWLEWDDISLEESFTVNTLIFTGKITDVREVTVDYKYKGYGHICTENITLFDMHVENILYMANEDAVQENVTLGTPFSTQFYCKEFPILTKGKEFLVFCYSVVGKEKDSLELENYMDYWVYNPKDLLVELKSGYYISTSHLSDGKTLKNDFKLTSRDVAAFTTEAEFETDFPIDQPAEILEDLYIRAGEEWQSFNDLISKTYLVEKETFETRVKKMAQRYANGG